MAATVRLTATFNLLDGAPAKGTATIKPSRDALVADDTIRAGKVQIPLDDTGSLAVDLPATDDPAYGEPFTYDVTVAMHHAYWSTTGLTLPAAAGALDLADIPGDHVVQYLTVTEGEALLTRRVPEAVNEALADSDTLRQAVAPAVGAEVTSRGLVTGAQVAPIFETGAVVARRVAEKLRGAKVAVIFRHDDVQNSALDYLPIYAARGVRASWYVAVNHMGSTERGVLHATADNIKAIHAAGHEVGSHTMDHYYFEGSTEEQRRAQLAESKHALEALLGGGYICETFAYPGNMHLHCDPAEVLQHYLLGTSGVPTSTDAGGNNTAGTLDLGTWLAEYTSPILGATPAETTTKAQAWFDAQKTREGVTIYTLQAHNTGEMSVAHLTALLDVIEADPQVVTLTAREVAHYAHTYLTSSNGRHYHAPTGHDGTAEVPFRNDTAIDSGGVTVNRRGTRGRSFRAKVAGTLAAYLDTALVIYGVDNVQSAFENGHQINYYSAGNQNRVRQEITGGGLMNLIGTGMSYLRTTGMGIRAQRDGGALQAYSNAGAERFTVDTTRGTMWLPNLTAPPSGSGRLGEMCVVNGVLHLVTATGPTVWTPIATA